MKPQNKVKIKWSPEFAYAIGLITTDGNLSPDRRHFDFTSKDIDQIKTFMKCLGIKNKIGVKTSGSFKKKSNRVQFGDVNFYKFLLSIGLTPNKSKTLGRIEIPGKYFFDFLRGHLDGDGTFYSYWDPRWRSSFMFYTVFISASKDHIDWLKSEIFEVLKIKGHISKDGKSVAYNLRYAKSESMKLLHKIYYKKSVVSLKRKRLKIEKALSIIGLKL